MNFVVVKFGLISIEERTNQKVSVCPNSLFYTKKKLKFTDQ